jgi:molybdopterin synthase sulfur carrier subunit
MPVKILYFAWVREKTGKAEEIVDVPAGVGTVAELVAWLKGLGPEYAEAVRARRRDPRRHRSAATSSRRRASPERARSPSFPPVTGG